MTDRSLDELGPVDYLVVEFPAGASNFTGEMAKELLALVEAGTIRVIDVLILTKNEDGTIEAKELSDVEELGELQALEAQLADLRDRIVNGDLAPEERTQFIKTTGPQIGKAIEVLRHRCVPGQTERPQLPRAVIKVCRTTDPDNHIIKKI